MNLFINQEDPMVVAAERYIRLCKKYDNVWGKKPPTDPRALVDIYMDKVDFQNDEIILHFSIEIKNELYYITKFVYINGIKADRNKLAKYLN